MTAYPANTKFYALGCNVWRVAPNGSEYLYRTFSTFKDAQQCADELS